MATIQLTSVTQVPAAAISVSFVRSGGPGGQNVNKVSSAVELRFDLDTADLPAAVRARLFAKNPQEEHAFDELETIMSRRAEAVKQGDFKSIGRHPESTPYLHVRREP